MDPTELSTALPRFSVKANSSHIYQNELLSLLHACFVQQVERDQIKKSEARILFENVPFIACRN